MIWVIGGTSEAKEFVDKIHGLSDYIVTVATYAGAEVLKNENVVVKRMSYDDMVEFIVDKNIKTIVDLSHPFATEVSKNARNASSKERVGYFRYNREKSIVDDSEVIKVKDIAECKAELQKIKGNVFFTTGSKNIEDFEKVKGNNRFIYRVLPTKFSIDECVKNNVDLKDIIAIFGPFSKDFNKNLFSEYSSDYVVMKDSGKNGGTIEKVEACKELGIKVIMLEREEEEGIDDIDRLVEMVL